MNIIDKELIEQKVVDILTKMTSTPPEDIKPTSTIKDDLGLDSLDVAELSVDLETEYQINIALWEFEKLTTVGAVVEYLDSVINPVGM